MRLGPPSMGLVTLGNIPKRAYHGLLPCEDTAGSLCLVCEEPALLRH
jgi:hypothetical protein